MKLRIARKMDRGGLKRRARDERDKRPWWHVYSGDQLDRAERRLARAWKKQCPRRFDGEGKAYRDLTEDFFRANRVNSRKIRRGALRKANPEKYR